MNGGQMISNGRPHEIKIQKLAAPVQDTAGFENDETWEDYYTNYAYINNLTGNERWMAAQIDSDMTTRFVLRWHPALDAVVPKHYRIVFAEKPYTITFVDNVQYRNDTVKIDALEVGSWDSMSCAKDSDTVGSV